MVSRNVSPSAITPSNLPTSSLAASRSATSTSIVAVLSRGDEHRRAAMIGVGANADWRVS